MKILRKTFSDKPTPEELDKAGKDIIKKAVPTGAFLGTGLGLMAAENKRVKVHNDKIRKVGSRVREIVGKAHQGDPTSAKIVKSIAEKRDQFWKKVSSEADKVGRKAGKKTGVKVGMTTGLAITGLQIAQGLHLRKSAKKQKEQKGSEK